MIQAAPQPTIRPASPTIPAVGQCVHCQLDLFPHGPYLSLPFAHVACDLHARRHDRPAE